MTSSKKSQSSGRGWRVLRHLAWPAVATLASIVMFFTYEAVAHEIGLAQETLRRAAGSFSYFAWAWLAGRLVGLALERSATTGRRVPRLLKELVAAAFFIAALVATIMLFLGQSMSGALASSGLVLAVIGFAIRNVVADAFSGIALGLDAPYRIGDWVDIDGASKGRIIEIGWRTTRLQTRDSTYMILPNSQIARQRLTNYSAPRRNYRAQLQILLPHELPIPDARNLLAGAAARSELALNDPKPDARAVAYERSGIRYTVRYWVPSFAEEIDCRDSVLGHVDAALREAQVPPAARYAETACDYALTPAWRAPGAIAAAQGQGRKSPDCVAPA
ncbi:mechanosensitive ion channel family protein [Aquibaculum sediminis]|uniref:mechanosensitive ion channel family protein n=1 Tax=Aquibaculum sediminis TaxID=3231907 RepID=UPI003454AD86